VRWPDGPVCPHCGNADPEAITGLKGKAHRPGLYSATPASEQFTVTVGTVFERSKIALNKWWLYATHLLGSHQRRAFPRTSSPHVGRHLQDRVVHGASHPRGDERHAAPARLAAKARPSRPTKPTSAARDAAQSPHASGQALQSRARARRRQGSNSVPLSPSSSAAASPHVPFAGRHSGNVREVLVRNVDRKSCSTPTKAASTPNTGKEFATRTVKHSAARVRSRGDAVGSHQHRRNVFSVFKRGMIGVYQHCGEAHLHRYLAEFDFRYNRRTALEWTDGKRTTPLLEAIEGKRLTYRRIGEASSVASTIAFQDQDDDHERLAANMEMLRRLPNGPCGSTHEARHASGLGMAAGRQT
jgi:hypothetical protein